MDPTQLPLFRDREAIAQAVAESQRMTPEEIEAHWNASQEQRRLMGDIPPGPFPVIRLVSRITGKIVEI